MFCNRLIPAIRRLAAISLALPMLISAAPLRGGVVSLRIDGRQPFADGHSFGRSGPYERVTGRAFFAVDPQAVANAPIVDLGHAPRNAQGLVEFDCDFFLLRPVDLSRGNRRLFYDVNNRGNKLALGAFNDRGGNDPASLADAGNGFLMREGYSILWCGWNGDVLPRDTRLTIRLPVAVEADGTPITGRAYAEICVNAPTRSQPFAWGNSDPYPAADPDHHAAQLTMRPSRDAPPVAIPHDGWLFAREEDGQTVPSLKHVFLREGFRPGWLYDLVYTARDPRVTGLGFAAVRDLVSYLRYEASATSPAALPVERAYVFGISQSGRFIQHFIYEGFNTDEGSRVVFDGAMAHVGGGGRGYFNHRFAQTTRHGSQHEERWFPSEVFPFTTVPQQDPVTGETGDTLSRARRRGPTPRIFYTETSTEYWCRGASLLHTDVTGRHDVELDRDVRMYFIAGAQHGAAAATDRGIYQNLVNPLDYRPVLRALLVALDRWVSAEADPPESSYPRIDQQTLVSFDRWQRAMPAIPGVNRPTAPYTPLRLDFGPRFVSKGIADHIPPEPGEPYAILVPAVDEDGNELAGIRLPELAVPRATLSGWNLRSAESGAAGALGRWAGSYIPFPATTRDRERSGDPRRSLEERYPVPEVYVSRFAAAALGLYEQGYLLEEDVVRLLRRGR